MTEAQKDGLEMIFPPEQSMNGRNAFYQFCDARQQQVSYAVCLHTVKKIEDGTMPSDQFTECQRGYCHNRCAAKVMKKEEAEAGQALYFIPRREEVCRPLEKAERKSDGAVSSGKYDMSNASYARGWAIGGGAGEVREPKKRIPPPPKPSKPKTGFIEEDMSDLVNVLSEESKKGKVAPKAAPVKAAVPEPAKETLTTIRPKPGESMADFIKRRAALSKANQEE